MSASSKKKLRKEQNAAQVAEKKQTDRKKSRQLKISSAIFACVIVAILVAGIAVLIVSGIKSSAIIERNTTALTLEDGHKLNSIEMAYYYIDTVETQMNQNSMSLMIQGLDFTKPLDEQDYNKDQTWAEYFIDLAATRARDEYAIRKAAEKAGFELSEDNQNLLKSAIQEKSLSATLNYGYPDFDSFLKAYYCNGANEKSYTDYLYTGLIAESFYTEYGEGLEFTDEQRREHEKDKYNEYSSFNYASYFISYSNYLDKDVTVTNATDAQKKDALAKAKADADKLKACKTVEELDKAISELAFNKDKSTAAESVKNSKILYTNLQAKVQEWIAKEGRKAGDTLVYANESTSTDADGKETKNTSGYTVVFFQSRNDNNYKLSNVRHLLVQFQGGKYDSTTGITTYSEDEKKKAKDEAEKLLKQWKDGEATEDSFIELVKKETDDTASAEDGGLYEEISPSSSFVTSFRDWAVDEKRKAGDVGIVESEYGYHIMYFSGYADITYRDSLIDLELLTESMEKWYKDITEAVDMKLGNTRHLNTALVLQSGEQ